MLYIENNCTLIHWYLFFIKGDGTSKTLRPKLLIQGLLRLYNKNMSFDLTKIKALLMASIGKVAFNIDGLTVYSTLNIPIQQFLFNYQTYH